MRTIAQIQADIDTNEAQFADCRKYFGAMWNCDVQAHMFRQSSNGILRRLKEELATVSKEQRPVNLTNLEWVNVIVGLGWADSTESEDTTWSDLAQKIEDQLT